jgi:membrane-associated phospholipid phosphatase
MPAPHPRDRASASSGAEVEQADIRVAEELGRYRDDSTVRALGALSEIADQAPALTVCGIVLIGGLIARKPRVAEAGARMLASVLVATAIKGIVKKSVSRARPHVLLEKGEYRFEKHGPEGGDWHSFPSGHTADAVAAARGLARACPELRAPAYAVAAAIGAVQIPRAKHYPLDVAAGAVIGIAAEFVVDLAGRYAWAEAVGSRRSHSAERAHDTSLQSRQSAGCLNN